MKAKAIMASDHKLNLPGRLTSSPGSQFQTMTRVSLVTLQGPVVPSVRQEAWST